MCVEELIKFLNRIKDTIRKIEPMITCNPWKPVAMKNVDPNVESAIQKGASMYSKAWNVVKIAPRVIVKIRAIFDLLKFFLVFRDEIRWFLLPMIITRLCLKEGFS